MYFNKQQSQYNARPTDTCRGHTESMVCMSSNKSLLIYEANDSKSATKRAKNIVVYHF